ncbi:MAG: NnrU family protein [Xanthomonadales bacterium]
MTWLIIGVALWSATHLMPSAAPGMRQALVGRLGEKPYKGLFALAIVAALALIILGWKSSLPGFVYLPPTWGRHATALLVLIAFILFSASHGRNNIQRIVRHPQLTAVAIWGIGHLLANGEARSVILFGGLTVWAALAIVLINRREGARVKPEPVARRKDVIAVVAGIVVYAIVAGAHRWLFGVSPFV